MTSPTSPTSLSDPGPAALLEKPHHAVVSTLGRDGSIHSTVVWVDVEDGRLAVNSAVGRAWPTNLQNNPTISVVVYDESNPYDYLEVRGTAESRLEGADDHIDRLAKKYTGLDTYPLRKEGEQRITFLVEPTRVRHYKTR